MYVAHLRKQGKSSAGAVENCALNHVTKAKPEIAQRPANAITARDVVALLRPLVEAGKGRQAGKLRAYLRAAFALAARAEVDSAVPSGFLAFGVEGNPVAATGTLSEFNRVLDRALSDPELRAYRQAVKDLPDSPARDAMLLGLLLGGQRTAQVVRAKTADVDVTARTLRLLDPKGKRAQPRPHILPLPDAAFAVVERCIARSEAQAAAAEKAGADVASWPGYLFSTHGGAPLRPETVTNAATELADDAARQATRRARHQRPVHATRHPAHLRNAPCRARHIARHAGTNPVARTRRRAAKHYDRHDYLQEKIAALTAWATHLETKPVDNVRHCTVADAGCPAADDQRRA